MSAVSSPPLSPVAGVAALMRPAYAVLSTREGTHG